MSGAMPNDQPVPPFNDKIDLSGISLNVAQMGNEIEIPKLAENDVFQDFDHGFD